MANKNFVVQNGLTVGALSIDATSGNITTSGTIVVTGSSPASFTSINNTPIGNVTPSSGAFTTISTTSDVNVGGNLVVTGTTTFNGGTLTLGDAPTDNVVFGADVNSSIVPNTDATYNLGSVSQQWNNLYVTGTASIDTLAVDENATVTGTLGITGATTMTTATADGLQSKAIGNVTPGSGAFTTLTASGVTTVTSGTASTSTSSGALVITGGLGVSGAIYAGSLQGTPIGSTSASTGAFTTGTFSSTLGVTGATTLTTATTGGLQATAIGNVTPGSGAFTTLTASGITQITNSTNATGANSGALQVTGGASFGGNVYVAGNLQIAGTQTVFTSNVLEVSDPMIYISTGNTGDVLDIGIVGQFTNPGYQHTGFVRDASDGTWKLFANVATEPSDSTLDFTNATYSPIRVGNFTGAAGTFSSTLGVTGLITSTGGISGGASSHTTGTFSSTLGVSGRTTTAGVTTSASILASSHNTIDIGASGTTFATVYATTFSGVSTTAKYADLAENYQADSNYQPGQVLMFGGDHEVTIASADTTAVAGVVSTNPAHLMNGGLKGNNVVALALTGRVPCNVIGPVKKGDLLVSAGFGYAKVNNTPAPGTIIGKSLADFTGAKGQIEVVVGRF